MKRFLSFVVGFLATVGLIVTLGVILVIVTIIQHKPKHQDLSSSMVLTLTLDDSIKEHVEPTSFPFRFLEDSIDLHDIIFTLEKAARDPAVKGLFVDAREPALGLAQLQELRDAIISFRANGKKAYLATDSFGEVGNGTGIYYLASAFDRITVQPSGFVGIPGIALEQPFLREAFDKWGIGVEVEKRAEYKTAFDFATEKSMTAYNREMLTNLLAHLTEQIIAGISAGRHLDKDQIWNAMNRAPLTAEDALQEKLIDDIAYPDREKHDLLKAARADNVNLNDYGESKSSSDDDHNIKVAVLYASGAIVRQSADGSALSSSVIAADDFTDTIDDILEDNTVRAVVVRVDSPGGSAIASETVRRGILRLKEAGLPVVISMGNYAASGGYWMSVDADIIVAQPATLTGSIGVLGGKIALRELLEKHGIHVESLSLNDNAAMWSMVDRFTPGQRKSFAASLDYTYSQFLKRVSEGRHLPVDKVTDIAKGRVWTGDEAKTIGLVDRLGGLNIALREARILLKISENAPVTVETYPKSHSPFDRLFKLVGQPSISAMVWKNLSNEVKSHTQTLSAPLLKIQ